MTSAFNALKDERCLVSGNEAIARAVWEAGANVASAYPGTPSTEILEYLSQYSDIYTHIFYQVKPSCTFCGKDCLKLPYISKYSIAKYDTQ